MLNAEIFSGREVGENAKLLLRFVKHSERLSEHANQVQMSGLALSARHPGVLHLASHTQFGEGWGTTYDLGLPTASLALGRIYKKRAM